MDNKCIAQVGQPVNTVYRRARQLAERIRQLAWFIPKPQELWLCWRRSLLGTACRPPPTPPASGFPATFWELEFM